MTDRRAEAEAAVSDLLDACSAIGLLPSIAEPETLAGRPSGRIRLVLRSTDARDLAAALRRHAVTTALER